MTGPSRIVIPSDEYPLSWPLGVPRTKEPKASKFSGHTFHRALVEVQGELRHLGASTMVISSNVVHDRVKNGDHGIAVYWTAWTDDPSGAGGSWDPHVMTCDLWKFATDNLHAIALSLQAIRGLDRWGAVRKAQAYAGFRALPPAGGATDKRPWREVLGIPTDGWTLTAPNDVLLMYAKTRFRDLSATMHPDRGGDPQAAMELGAAYEDAIAELETKT